MSKKHKAFFPKRIEGQIPSCSDVATGTQSVRWVRRRLTAELLSDAHLGTGSGGGGIDALVARDRQNHPVLWASHIEGVLRDAARRLHGDVETGNFFGGTNGERQRAVFTSLYAEETPDRRHIWRSTSREAFDNRAPKDDTLRVIEYVPKGTKFVGEVELPANDLPTLQRLVQEVDALGSGRSAGAGRVNLSLSDAAITPRKIGAPTGRLTLLLKNRDPLCITATATPDNLIPSLAFIPGRALLGAVAAWLIAEGDRDTASLLTSGKILVNDALPLPSNPTQLDGVEVLPAPLTLHSEKPKGAAGNVPWWAQPTSTDRFDAWDNEEKLKRPDSTLSVYRASAKDTWTTFSPVLRIRLRNGRPDPEKEDASLFAIEQIVEKTPFLTELQGSPEDLKKLAEKLAPVLEGRRWLRVGRAGAPVEVAQLAWSSAKPIVKTVDETLLTLTSDLLVRDEYLRWCTTLDDDRIKTLLGDDIQLIKSEQDSVMVHGFNGTSRLWRMPAAAIRRGSVFKVKGASVAKLEERAAKGEWLGERTHEGFGRFRLDVALPGVTGTTPAISTIVTPAVDDIVEEDVAAKTQEWFNAHKSLAKLGGGSDRKPSLSQWQDLVNDLDRDDRKAIEGRLYPTTAGGKNWKHRDANAILEELNKVPEDKQKLFARFFVRWLRAYMRKEAR
jgi:hypothetical protein